MKFKQILTESESFQYEVRRMKITNIQDLQEFSDFYNTSGQLTWQLTPTRLKQKMGSKGRLWGLFIEGTDSLVGTIGLKEIEDELGEIGYLMIHENHRSLKNVLLLYKAAFKYSRKFNTVYVTTNIKNKTINKLLDRFSKIDKMFKIRSPFGGGANNLFVWVVNTGKQDVEHLTNFFKENIIQEF